MLYAIFAVIVIIADQWVKFWVSSNLVVDTDVVSFIPGFVSLTNVHNSGVAFGLFSNANIGMYIAILSAVLTLFVIVALATRLINGPIGRWSAVLVAAGGLSNAIDRLLYPYVQDMFRFDFLPSFPVFNVADIFITVFGVLLVIDLLFGGEYGLFGKPARRDDEDEDEEEDLPAEKPAKKSKRSKAAAAEEDDEEEDAPVARKKAAKAEKPAKAPKEKANEYAAYKQGRTAAKAPVAAPAQEDFSDWNAAAAAAETKAEPAAPAAPVAAEKPAAPVAPAKPAAPAAPAKPAPAADEFDLESILNEFK